MGRNGKRCRNVQARGRCLNAGSVVAADFLLLRTGSLEFLQRGTTNLVGAQHLVDQFDRFATLALGFLNNVSMFTNELDIKHAS